MIEYADRIRIDSLYRAGKSVEYIANEIGCCRATVYNELKRCTYIHKNSDWTYEVRYNPEGAQRMAEWNQTAKGPGLKIDKDHDLAKFIEKMICDERYSPEAVLLYIKTHPDECKFAVEIKSPRTIYSYIDKGIFLRAERCYLPQGHRHRTKKKKKVVIRRTPKRDRIDQRPQEAEERKIFGHWEMDTVKSGEGDKSAALVLTERKTRFEIVEPLKSDTTDEVRKALNRIEKDWGSVLFKIMKTTTCDNGSEFQDPDAMEKSLYRKKKRMQIFYCNPYSSWERGSNENNNKLIRRRVPKGHSFNLNRRQIKHIEYWINHYPRRMFNGKSSYHMFLLELRSAGLNIPAKVLG